MYRILLFLALLTGGPLGCRQQYDPADPLPGPVSSLADLPTTYQPIEAGAPVRGRLKSQVHNGQRNGEWRYNAQGQLLEWRSYDNGNVARADQYRYDAAGRLRYVQRFDNGCGFSSSRPCTGPVVWAGYDELKTDALGRVTEARSFSKRTGSNAWIGGSITRYEYDADGRAVRVLRKDNAGQLSSTETLTYDAGGNVVAVRAVNRLSQSADSVRTTTYQYDNRRNPYFGTVYYVAPFFSSRSNQLFPGTTYEYNADGYPVRIRQNNVVTELTYY